MTQTTLPSRDVLKGHARNLRQTLSHAGTPISHSTALEHVAHQWGYRDWNTLSDAIAAPTPRVWSLGQRVSGHYRPCVHRHHPLGPPSRTEPRGTGH